MENHTLHVDGMSCKGCEAVLKSQVQSLGHVSSVEVDWEAGTVEFLTPDADGVPTVENAIEELGYEVVEHSARTASGASGAQLKS